MGPRIIFLFLLDPNQGGEEESAHEWLCGCFQAKFYAIGSIGRMNTAE